MLNTIIQQKILSSLHGTVLSTSMVARKTSLSRITVSKYLNALAGKNVVQAVRVGKAVAWRASEHKPVIAIIAKPGTARVVKLALGEKYTYLLTTNANVVRDAFLIIADNKLPVKIMSIPVVLIGCQEENAYCLPELFDTYLLKTLVKKILHEQTAPMTHANASIVLEHFDEFEEALGIDKADELLKLTNRLLREAKVPVKQYERTTFLIDGELAEGVLLDIEQTFHVLLAHVYGRMVTPGDNIISNGTSHTVPSLTITLSIVDELEH